MKFESHSPNVIGALARSAGRATVLAAVMLGNLGCADVLGIDSPQTIAMQSAGAGGDTEGGSAGFGAAQPKGGAAGESASGDGGDGGVNTSDSVFISGPASTDACQGTEASVSLTAGGGHEPYTWSLPGGTDVFTLVPSKENSSLATLRGSPAGLGDTAVKVQVADGGGSPPVQRTFTIHVGSVPKIKPPTVASVCPNEVYSLPLEASGGDAQHYTWSTDLPDSTGLTIPAGESKLSGTFQAPAGGAKKLDFTLRLDDGSACHASPIALSLPLDAASAAACAHVDDLPPPCLDYAYDQKLVARGPAGAWDWSVVGEPPPGLEFTANTAKISGTPTAIGTLTVHATNAISQRTFEASLALKPRDKCWFAYVSKTAQLGQLNLFDPILGNRQALPEVAAGESVLDFEFSPSGEYLAYRLAAPAADPSLVIVRLRDFAKRRFDFVDVTHFAWSPDSQFLAVAHRVGTDDDLSLIQTGSPIPSAVSPPALSFVSYGPTKVSIAAMSWSDPSHLTFFERANSIDPDLWYLGVLQVAANGPGTPKIYQEFFGDGDLLVPAAYGVFTVSAFVGTLFYSNDGSAAVTHGNVLIAPSGRYVANAQAHSLELFRSGDDSTVGSPHKVHLGCDALLAWASGQERLACAGTDAASHAQLSFFDMNSDTDQLSMVSDSGVALSGSVLGQRRLFAPSGTRFAFTTASTVNVVAFDAGAPQVMYSLPSGSAAPNGGELAFSADEQLLLQHRGTQLLVLDAAHQHAQTVATDLAASEACSEDFIDEASTWCGAPPAAPTVRWSQNIDLAAYQNAAGALQIADLTSFSRGILPDPTAVEAACLGCPFAFQP